MSYKEFFEGHAVNTTITEIKDILSTIIDKYPDTKNIDEIIKIDTSIQYIVNEISNVNFNISPRSLFDKLNTSLQNAKSYLTQYHANRSNQLNNAISSIEEAVVYAQQIIQNNPNQKHIVNMPATHQNRSWDEKRYSFCKSARSHPAKGFVPN